MSVQSKMLFARRWMATTGAMLKLSGQAAVDLERRKRFKQLAASIGRYDVQPTLGRASAEDLLGASPEIRLIHPRAGVYQVTLFELAVIVSAVVVRGPSSIFEIGTFDGRTTLNMRLNAPDGATVTTIDLPPAQANLPGGKRPGELLDEPVAAGRIEQLHGNSHTFDFSPWEGKQDLVFVDAGHGYEAVRTDSETALRLTEGRDAIILWHDYATAPGVTRAIDELVAARPGLGRWAWIEDTTLACLIRSNGRA